MKAENHAWVAGRRTSYDAPQLFFPNRPKTTRGRRIAAKENVELAVAALLAAIGAVVVRMWLFARTPACSGATAEPPAVVEWLFLVAFFLALAFAGAALGLEAFRRRRAVTRGLDQNDQVSLAVVGCAVAALLLLFAIVGNACY